MTDLREWDVVRLTGTAGDGTRYADLTGTVATVSKDGWVKVWPDGDEGDGKLWFEVAKLESVAVLEREEP